MDWVKQFVDLFLHLDTHLSQVISQYGTWTYLILFLIVFCETGLVTRTRDARYLLGVRTATLVFLVLLVHSLPEGFAVGTAYASERAGLGLFVIVAIAIQNIPEGTSVAIPMEAAGFSRSRQFWAAVGTSAPQPVGAIVAFLAVDQVSALLPFSFAFAAGAMLSLITIEMLPEAYRPRHPRGPTIGLLVGATLMVGLDLMLGV